MLFPSLSGLDSGPLPWHELAMHFPGFEKSRLSCLLIAATLSGCCCSPHRNSSPTSESKSPPVSVAETHTPSHSVPPSAATTPALASPPKHVEFGPDPKPMMDGQSLTGWRVTDFAGAAEVRVEPAFRGGGPAIVLEQGVMTGITWTNDLPTTKYEINLEAMRVSGGDFFCALTFPVGKDPCSFIVGGWGGGVVGLSNVDGEDAAHNETTQYMKFEEGRWYGIRVRVLPNSIQAWIDGEQMVNLLTEDRKIDIRAEVELSKPLGLATWSTTGAIRKMTLQTLK